MSHRLHETEIVEPFYKMVYYKIIRRFVASRINLKLTSHDTVNNP